MSSSEQRIGRVAGVLFLITFITAISALWLFQPVLDDPAGYIAGAGDDNRILLGALMELLLIVANVGTAVVLYPIMKRQNELLAVGYVTARLVECTFIAIGLFSVLGVVSLGQEAVGAEGDSLGALGYALAAIKDWTFILGPGFIVGIGNGLILGYLFYRSGLVPRGMAMLGLIGGPLICLAGSPCYSTSSSKAARGRASRQSRSSSGSCRSGSTSPSRDSGRLPSSRGMLNPFRGLPDRHRTAASNEAAREFSDWRAEAQPGSPAAQAASMDNHGAEESQDCVRDR